MRSFRRRHERRERCAAWPRWQSGRCARPPAERTEKPCSTACWAYGETTLDGLVGQRCDAVCCRMGQRSQPFRSIVGDRANPLRSRLGQRSQPIRCSVGKRRHLVCRRTNPIRGGFCKRPDSGGGGLRERPYSIGCGVDHRSDTISGRVDEILRRLAQPHSRRLRRGGNSWTRFLRCEKPHAPSVKHFPPYRHLVRSDRMAPDQQQTPPSRR